MLLTFEPVTSHAYELAREEYRTGALELRLADSQKGNDRSNFYCSKSHFIRCVSILNNLHSIGQVECVDRLPIPEIIPGFNQGSLESLSDTLRDLYFPEVI